MDKIEDIYNIQFKVILKTNNTYHPFHPWAFLYKRFFLPGGGSSGGPLFGLPGEKFGLCGLKNPFLSDISWLEVKVRSRANNIIEQIILKTYKIFQRRVL